MRQSKPRIPLGRFLTRRRFGLLLATFGLFVPLSRLGRSRAAIAQKLLRLQAHDRSAYAVGLILSQNQSFIKDQGDLVNILLRRLQRDGNAVLAMTDKDLRQAISVCIRADFAEDRTVSANGWILSQTEAQLCVLARHGIG